MLPVFGAAVIELRLEQQPREYWELPPRPPGDADYEVRERAWVERARVEEALRSTMPYSRSKDLELIVASCPNLQTLLIDGFAHPHGTYEPQPWRECVAVTLPAALPRLRRMSLHAVDVLTVGASPPYLSGTLTADIEADGLLLPLLERTALTQLAMEIGPESALGILRSPHTHRLLQLSLCGLGPSQTRLICRCTSLERLNLKQCDFGSAAIGDSAPINGDAPSNDGAPSRGRHLSLSPFFPRSLRVLALDQCSSQAQPSLEDCHTRLSRLEHLSVPSEYYDGVGATAGNGPLLTASGPLVGLDCVCRLPALCFLNIEGSASLFGDSELGLVASHCHSLHSLWCGHTAVTARGFASLEQCMEPAPRGEPGPLLARLRVAHYTNARYECELGQFGGATVSRLAELEAEAMDEMDKPLTPEEELEEQVNEGLEALGMLPRGRRADAKECIRTFFAFCELAARRALEVPWADDATWASLRYQRAEDRTMLCDRVLADRFALGEDA